MILLDVFGVGEGVGVPRLGVGVPSSTVEDESMGVGVLNPVEVLDVSGVGVILAVLD